MSDTKAWRYSINYGPDGEENYAFVYDANGDLVSNLKTHHAVAVVAAMNAFAASPHPIVAEGVEPVAIYHGNGVLDCGDAGHHNVELLKIIPAGTPLYAALAREAPAVEPGEAPLSATTCFECDGPLNGPYCPACRTEELEAENARLHLDREAVWYWIRTPDWEDNFDLMGWLNNRPSHLLTPLRDETAASEKKARAHLRGRR